MKHEQILQNYNWKGFKQLPKIMHTFDDLISFENHIFLLVKSTP